MPLTMSTDLRCAYVIKTSDDITINVDVYEDRSRHTQVSVEMYWTEIVEQMTREEAGQFLRNVLKRADIRSIIKVVPHPEDNPRFGRVTQLEKVLVK